MRGPERRVQRALTSTGWTEGDTPTAIFAVGSFHKRLGRIELMFRCRHGYGSGFVHEHKFVTMVIDSPTNNRKQRAIRARNISSLVHEVVRRHHERAGIADGRFDAPEWADVVVL